MYYEDQINRRIFIKNPPQRIISTVPSQTELLFYLGLKDILVGITKFCIHPESVFKSKTKIGGTKNIHFEKIEKLQPDLIICNKEENDRAQIEELAAKYTVWVSDVKTLEDALAMIKSIGQITHTSERAGELILAINEEFKLQLKKPDISVPALYLIWRKPYMSVGKDTFIHDMMVKTGFQNTMDQKFRYPKLNKSEIQALNPKYILLSSEPFPFKEKHIAELREICPSAVIRLVDGEFFSWYGSRLLLAIPYLATLQSEIIAGLQK